MPDAHSRRLSPDPDPGDWLADEQPDLVSRTMHSLPSLDWARWGDYQDTNTAVNGRGGAER